MRAFLAVMMLLVAWPCEAQERPSFDQIARMFEAISFSSEYGAPRSHFDLWQGVPVRISAPAIPRGDIEPVISEMRTLTDLEVVIVSPGESFNLTVSFGSTCQMTDGNSTRPTRITVQAHRLRRCLYAELFQAVGPDNDACHYRPSLFCDGEKNTEPTSADRIIMKATFDKRLRRGMKPDEAMPIARVILRELYDAWERGERF